MADWVKKFMRYLWQNGRSWLNMEREVVSMGCTKCFSILAQFRETQCVAFLLTIIVNLLRFFADLGGNREQSTEYLLAEPSLRFGYVRLVSLIGYCNLALQRGAALRYQMGCAYGLEILSVLVIIYDVNQRKYG